MKKKMMAGAAVLCLAGLSSTIGNGPSKLTADAAMGFFLGPVVPCPPTPLAPPAGPNSGTEPCEVELPDGPLDVPPPMPLIGPLPTALSSLIVHTAHAL